MTQDFSAPPSPDDLEVALSYADSSPTADSGQPSLPVVLLSAASGIACGVVGLYLTFIVLGWEIQPSVFVAVLGMCLGLGMVGAGLSAVTHSRTTLPNIVISCGLIFLALLFFGLCTVFGALAATLLLVKGG